MAGININVGIKSGKFRSGLEDMRAQAKKFSQDVSRDFGSSFSGMRRSLVGALSVGALAAGFDQLLQKFGKVQDMAERFGESAESIQRVGAVAAESGTEIEGVARAMSRLTIEAQKATDGGAEQEAMFAAVGIKAREFRDLSLEEKVLALSAAWQRNSTTGEGVARMMELLGARGQKLIPMLTAGPEALQKQLTAVVVASAGTISSLDQLGDAWEKAKQAGSAFAAETAMGAIKLGQTQAMLAKFGFGVAKGFASGSPIDGTREASKQFGKDMNYVWGEKPRGGKSKGNGEDMAAAAEEALAKSKERARVEKESADERRKLEEEIARLTAEADMRELDNQSKLAALETRRQELWRRWIDEANKNTGLEARREMLGVEQQIAEIQTNAAQERLSAEERIAALRKKDEDDLSDSIDRERELAEEDRIEKLSPAERKTEFAKQRDEYYASAQRLDAAGSPLEASQQRLMAREFQKRIDAERTKDPLAGKSAGSRSPARIAVDSMQSAGLGGGSQGGGGVSARDQLEQGKITNQLLREVIGRLQPGLLDRSKPMQLK